MSAIEQLRMEWNRYFEIKGWQPHAFQKDCATKYFNGYHGLLNAPTGSGKTMAMALPAMIKFAQKKITKPKGPFLIWITPLKALGNDLLLALQDASNTLGYDFQCALRNGDTPVAARQKQKTKPPHCLVITPESLHLLMASKGANEFLGNVECLIVDEWHELLGGKRGVQVELAASRLLGLNKKIKVWAISATIGNLTQAMDIIIPASLKSCIIKAKIDKITEIHTIYPDTLERLPWAGHLGIKLLDKIMPVLDSGGTTLLFTNTRSQSEIWYQSLLKNDENLAGLIAIHHGSLDRQVREWVEENLHNGHLKVVVCTSSLDLGVDFRPVDKVIQVGSPKGMARFMQRAGRSGHKPGEKSKIWFVPTHSLELVEAACLKYAASKGISESRTPVVRAFDVLIQYLLTLATGDGFRPEFIFEEIRNTHAFQSITTEEWNWILAFICTGGIGLEAYDQYNKISIDENGLWKIASRKLAMEQRFSIGTIAGESSVYVKLSGGPVLGNIEEYFITKMNPGDTFVYAGKVLEFIRLEGNKALVKKSHRKSGIVASWQGGRMSLSNELGKLLKVMISNWETDTSEEMKFVKPLFELQNQLSSVPNANELLVEYHETEDGFHLFVFPFAGRMVNEGMAALLAHRLGKIKNSSYSIAMNDYGFELLSPDPIPFAEALEEDLFDTKNLISDLFNSTNYTEMARRKFSQIATISGLIFKGKPNQPVRARHMQANAALFYNVFSEYDPNNLLLQQAMEETLYYQLDEHRLREVLNEMATQHLIIKYPVRPTPFSFPIMVDRLREEYSNEKLEDRIEKMLQE